MTPKFKRTLIRIIAWALLGLSLTSCATMRGLGEDISAGGRGLQKAAS
ncbi:MAG TPA: entericidin A/B family lipoprotein [Luteolibacter sp.]|nr:entericidin A/B family lipoprotein [Luteolibacter sp.]